MGKVIFRLPSKGTQYGYAEYHFEGDYLDDGGYELGVEYKHFVDNFQRGEAAGQAASKAVAKPKPVVIASVAANKAAEKARQAVLEAQTDARKEVLDEQFGSNFREPVTEAELLAAVSVIGSDAPEDVQAEALQLLVDGLGASVYDEEIEEDEAPWETPPPPASDDDWDF